MEHWTDPLLAQADRQEPRTEEPTDAAFFLGHRPRQIPAARAVADIPQAAQQDDELHQQDDMIETSEASSSSTSSGSEASWDPDEPDWRRARVFTCDDASRDIDLPWHDGYTVYRNIAQHLGCSMAVIDFVHTLRFYLSDLQ